MVRVGEVRKSECGIVRVCEERERERERGRVYWRNMLLQVFLHFHGENWMLLPQPIYDRETQQPR